jgi:DsbC/DsbD-like thiol-disulfide interchange protein
MNRFLNSALLGLCLLGGSALVAQAAVSPWVYSEGGKMRMSALADGGNKITAIIEIDPAPGWKTYWRDPGDAGMPPQIDLSAGRNLKLMTISYPAPEISRDEAGQFLGYHGPVSLVLELEKPDPSAISELNASVLVGLCKDICLPFQSSFTLPLANIDQPQADEFMKIQMAKAELPEKSSPAFQITDAALTSDKAFFEATIAAPGDAMPEIAAAPSSGVLLGGQPEISARDGRMRVRYAVTRLPKSLKGASVTLLVKAAGRSIETKLAID